MNGSIAVITGALVLTGLVLLLLYLLNYKTKDRYRQVWGPLLAILFCVAVLRVDILSLPPAVWLTDQLPNTAFIGALVLNVMLLVLFLGLKFIWRAGDTGFRLVTAFVRNKLPAVVRGINFLIARFLNQFPLGFRKKLITGGKGSRMVSLVYERNEQGVVLRPAWYYPAICTFYASLIAAGLFLAYILVLPFEWRTQVGLLLPPYPALSLLLFLELAWFLGGRRHDFSGTQIHGDDVDKRKISEQDALFEGYLEKWPDKVLAAKTETNCPLRKGEDTGSAYTELNSEDVPGGEMNIHQTIRRIRSQGFQVRDAHVDMITAMAREEHVIVRDPVYGEIRPYLMAALLNRLINHHRIVFIVKDAEAAAEAKKWLSDGLRESSGFEQLWTLSGVTEAFQQGRAPHMIIATIQELKKESTISLLTETFHGSLFDTYVMPEAERSLAFHAGALKNIALQLDECLPVKPVYWIFSQWYEKIEALVRQTFRVNLTEVEAKLTSPSPKCYYMVWKTEGEKFQKGLFSTLSSHRYITGEVSLAMYAQRLNTGDMMFVNQQSLPVKESISDLLDNREHLMTDMEMSGAQVRGIKDCTKMYSQYWSVPMTDYSFLLVRDTNYNLVDTLKHWWGNGRNSSFVHIISPPYLLRDYLAAKLDYHMQSSRTIAPLAVSQPSTPFGRVQPLLDLMLNNYVSEDKVREFLAFTDDQGEDDGKPVIERLEDCFISLFGANRQVIEAVKVKKERVFDTEEQQFVTRTAYNLTKKLKELIPSMVVNEIKIMKQSGEVVEQLNEGQLYQRYLPHQEHTFNGELCRVERISPNLSRMEVALTSNRQSTVYRQDRTYRIEADLWPVQSDRMNMSSSDNRLYFETAELPFSVSTAGYSSFDREVNVRDVRYVTLEEKDRNMAARRYERGKVARLTFELENRAADKDRIAFTLSFLLNELFVTLFPDIHDYIRAAAVLPEEFYGDDKESRMLRRMHPELETTISDDDDNRITIYLLEDSPSQLGAVESIRNNIDQIFKVLEDYLKWLIEEPENGETYLRFGAGNLLPLFAVEKTWDVLKLYLTGESLSDISERVSRETAAVDEERITEHECVFCQKTYRAVSTEETDDRRKRCPECAATAVDNKEMLEPMYKKMRLYLSEQFGVRLRRDHLRVTMVSAEDLHKESGLVLNPKSGRRMIGKASRDDDNTITVMVENGAPRLQTYMTLVHELTHVWQFDNLNLAFMTIDEIEGFASWVEIQMLRHFGEHDHAGAFEDNLKNRDDAYGRGYVQTKDLLEREGAGSPFEVYGVEAPLSR
ncbi:hypothetical protein [Alteribacter natronophilus]|uniref:hypothetical protein n=1 Tax=Alteribacter natronophilus TaxID=2583810 RepID=UPI00110D6C0F|nr:hypothetical protein [Alteribacter natronophilus]TMW70431.1 hypothetical protein FGB90_17345 [Alteribacter natronophilus]